jgi:hypothetical protein
MTPDQKLEKMLKRYGRMPERQPEGRARIKGYGEESGVAEERGSESERGSEREGS